MIKLPLIISRSNKFTSYQLRELLLSYAKENYPIYTDMESFLVIRECMALSIQPHYITSNSDCCNYDVYIFDKVLTTQEQEIYDGLSALNQECHWVTVF